MNKGTLLIISFIGNFNKLTISFEELLPFAQFCARDTRHLTFKLIEGNAYLRIHFEYFYFYGLFKARALRYPTRGIFQENRSPPFHHHLIRERRFGPFFQKPEIVRNTKSTYDLRYKLSFLKKFMTCQTFPPKFA